MFCYQVLTEEEKKEEKKGGGEEGTCPPRALKNAPPSFIKAMHYFERRRHKTREGRGIIFIIRFP